MHIRGRAIAKVAASAALALGVPGVAHADATAEQKAAATVLFRDARARMETGDVPGACRRFEESYRLDPLPGTQLNMAVCHEREGRTATAWVEFRDAAALARRDGRDDRVALAEEHRKALEPRLSSVRIVVSPQADVPSLTVTLDGAELARPAWDTALPVDPGPHVVGATAPSAKPFIARVEMKAEGETQTVMIDGLEVAAPPAVIEPPPPLPPGVVPANDGGGPRGGLSSRRLAAIAVGGAAIVGLGVGSYFGLDAFAKHADSDRGCPNNQCTSQAVVANDQSKTAADRATVAFAISLPALAVATYLWISGGEARAKPAMALDVVPVVRAGYGGISLARAF